PFAGDAQILEAVQSALNLLAVRDGLGDPALLQAVGDPHPAKRTAAGVALVEAKDKDAVPMLIDRLADTSTPSAWQVIELLERIAGDKAPAVYADSKTPPAKVRDAWHQWW